MSQEKALELLEALGGKVDGMRADIDASVAEKLAEAEKARTEATQKLIDENEQMRAQLASIDASLQARGLREVPGMAESMPKDLVTSVLRSISLGQALPDGAAREGIKAGFDANESELVARVMALEEAGMIRSGARTLQTLVDQKGGFMLPVEWASMIYDNTFRASTVLGQAGATVVNPKHTFKIARKNGNTVAYRRGEGTAVAASSISLGVVEMRPRGIGARSKITLEQMLFGDGRVETMNQADLIESILLKQDLDAFYGNGAENTPLGLFNTPGVVDLNLTSSSTRAMTWADVLELEQKLRDNKVNLAGARIHYVGRSRAFHGLRTQRVGGSTTGDGPYVFAPGSDFKLAMPFSPLYSEQFPANAADANGGDVFVGDFRPAMVARFGGLLVLNSEHANDGAFNAPFDGGKHVVVFGWDDFAYVTPPSMVYTSRMKITP